MTNLEAVHIFDSGHFRWTGKEGSCCVKFDPSLYTCFFVVRNTFFVLLK